MNFDRYVGIPFRERGRGFDGCDCWGLLWLVFQHELGIELPRFDGSYSLAADRAHLAGLIAGELPKLWDEVVFGSALACDGVLMRVGAQPQHVGLVTRPGMLLHVERGGDSAIVPYRAGAVRHRVLGFYRCRLIGLGERERTMNEHHRQSRQPAHHSSR